MAAGPKGSGPTSRVPRLVLIVLLLFTLALIALSIPAGFFAIFSGQLSQLLNFRSFDVTYLWIGPLPSILPFEAPYGAVFAALSAVYVGMFVLAARQSARPLEAIRATINGGVEHLFASPLLLCLLSIGFLGFTDTVMTYGVEAFGSTVGNPYTNVDPFLELTSLTFAPLREEFGFRVLLIGIVALVLSMGRPWRQGLKALWRPSVAYEGLSVGSGAALIVWAALVFSSITFGVCHVTCGSGGGGWAWGKVVPATFAGVVLGYLYIRFGIHVAVLAHWGVDYFGSVFSFFGQAAYGINWNSTTNEFFGQYLVDLDIVFLFGLASFLAVLYVGIRKLAEWRARGKQIGLVLKPPDVGVMAEP